MGTRGEMRWLIAAALVHGALLAMAPRAKQSLSGPAAPPPAAAEAEIAVEFTSPESPSRPSPPPLPPSSTIDSRVLARGELSAARGAPSESPAAVEPSPDTGFTFDPTQPRELSADAVGLGRNRFLGALPDDGARGGDTAAPSEADNVAPGVNRSVRDAMHERDVSVGLGSAGPVIAVAEEVTRPSDAPMNSRAVFEVAADGRGEVIGVQVVDASEGRPQWDKVATAMNEALRGRTLRVPPGTAGVTITLEVTSRWQLPSGHDPDSEVSVLGVPVKKARPESKQPIHMEFLKPTFKIVEVAPPPDTSPPVKLPSQRLEIAKIFGTDIDPTDFQPRPSRVVHAHVVREVVR